MVSPGPEQVVLARLRWWHIEPLLAIESALFGDEPWTARTFWSELGQVETRHYVVARAGDALVGYAGLCDYPDEAWVQTMAVAPACQGRGIGRRLLLALLEEAHRRGQRVVALEVRADNTPAQALYAAHGFHRTGIRRGYYQPSGTDAWVLTRRDPDRPEPDRPDS
ncbi:MAG TPA: ribosomal protein S18-alanine N-acetyltransferase [Mycobacteriales bacterium]|nr:ribosomal protein S18-alanine N-acetyltransferase [Mycobacteriales bacterium]